MAYEGEISDMHDPGIGAAIVKITPFDGRPAMGNRVIAAYFDTAEHAQTAADAMAVEAAAGSRPDTRFEVCNPRNTSFSRS